MVFRTRLQKRTFIQVFNPSFESTQQKLTKSTVLENYTYSRVSNNSIRVFIFIFVKSQACALLFHSSEQYYDSPVNLLFLGKTPNPELVFHTLILYYSCR